jgi:hypothetical protein
MQEKIHHVTSIPSQPDPGSATNAGLAQLQARVPALQRQPELLHANKEKEGGGIGGILLVSRGTVEAHR